MSLEVHEQQLHNCLDEVPHGLHPLVGRPVCIESLDDDSAEQD
jgi:hypothetical protein